MAKKKGDNQNKSEEEIRFENELKKLKLSAEHGMTFLDKKDDDFHSENEDDFLSRMKELEDAMANPEKRSIRELLDFPKFPNVQELSDDEVSAALELVNTALINKNIMLDVNHPTPDRKIYQFLTEELLEHDAGLAGAGGMMMHFIYEEFHPNFREDIKSDISDTLHFICVGYNASMPWRIAPKVKLYGKKVSQEDFEAKLAEHRHVFKGMSFISVDLVEIELDEQKAHATAQFRFYLDQSSGSPGEVQANAKFQFIFDGDCYLLENLVIDQFGIK